MYFDYHWQEELEIIRKNTETLFSYHTLYIKTFQPVLWQEKKFAQHKIIAYTEQLTIDHVIDLPWSLRPFKV